MTYRTREEHLAWCKARALEYLDAGDVANAIASMMSDMTKHQETGCNSHLSMLGLMYAAKNDSAGARRWIEGFN